MKYVIEKNDSNLKLIYYNVKMIGMDVTPKNGVKDLKIKAQKILLVDPELRENYIKERVNRKIDRVIKFMIRILNDDETTDSDVGMVLDEINKLKGIIINKYKEYILDSEYKSFLTKLIVIEEEFKRNYNQKIYMNNYGYGGYSIYEEELSEGRSR